MRGRHRQEADDKYQSLLWARQHTSDDEVDHKARQDRVDVAPRNVREGRREGPAKDVRKADRSRDETNLAGQRLFVAESKNRDSARHSHSGVARQAEDHPRPTDEHLDRDKGGEQEQEAHSSSETTQAVLFFHESAGERREWRFQEVETLPHGRGGGKRKAVANQRNGFSG